MDTFCFHCHNPITPANKVEGAIKSNLEYFCCSGCKLVAEMIYESGNEKFYDLRGNAPLSPVETEDNSRNENLDSEFTYNEYVIGQDHIKEVFINITNIHCSACVWLNEKVLSETEGVLKTRINFANGRAYVSWDDSKN